MIEIHVPGFFQRVFSIFLRHQKCYCKHLFSNGFPPFVEPIVFLAAIGIGLGRHIDNIAGMKYSQFVASGLVASTAMFTATFELTYGTYVRMEFENIYDSILSTPISIFDAFLGEILWAGAKGFFFSSAVLLVISLLGFVNSPFCVFAPFIGGATAVIYGALALIITSWVKDINTFNFYITGCCTPMFFLSGIILPINELPIIFQKISYFIPSTHSVNIIRSLLLGSFSYSVFYDIIFLAVFMPLCVSLAILCIKKRLIV